VTDHVGSDDGVRTWTLASPRSRRRCPCCKRRATHIGLGNGVALISGCEWRVRKWCKDPRSVLRMGGR